MDRTTLHIPPHVEQYSVVLLKEQGRGAFLVQERSRKPGTLYAGKLGLFGGRREGGESPETTARREVQEETGIELAPDEITLFARLLAQDESGNQSFGHFYWADDLNKWRIEHALKHKCDEGQILLLRRRDIGPRWDRLTSITSYAFGAYFDMERAGLVGVRPSLTASLAAFFGLGSERENSTAATRYR